MSKLAYGFAITEEKARKILNDYGVDTSKLNINENIYDFEYTFKTRTHLFNLFTNGKCCFIDKKYPFIVGWVDKKSFNDQYLPSYKVNMINDKLKEFIYELAVKYNEEAYLYNVLIDCVNCT